jgi:hypothetical protein
MKQTLESYKIMLNPSASDSFHFFTVYVGHYAFRLPTSGAIFWLRQFQVSNLGFGAD